MSMRWGAGLVAVALAVVGCGGSDAEGVYQITGEDYAYSGAPEQVEPGAAFSLANVSDGEVHEMVVARVADGEILTPEELIALPVEEMTTLMWFQGTLVALPGEDGVVPGDADTTSLVVEEPGQYLLLCLIPQGADPAVVEAVLEAGNPEEPLDLGDGELHARLGMTASFEVAAP